MMESWNDVIQVSMLGTDKRQLNDALLPEQIRSFINAAREIRFDKEEQFLNQAALLYNYKQCGILPLTNSEANILKAAPEEQEYAGTVAHRVLNQIISEDSPALLSVWLKGCNYKNLIVHPEFLPLLLEMAVKHKYLQPLVSKCAGKRGEWLSSFNDRWKFGSTLSDEELWETGSLEQRKLALQNSRKHDPAKGREMLQSVWAQENVSTKCELLKQLSINLCDDDIPWLESLLQEKNEKVKESSADLLIRQPSSSIVHLFGQILHQSLKIKEGRKILGIGNKSNLSLELPGTLNEIIFKWGIEKLSNQKGFSDNEYIIYQVISKVPPHFWQEWLQLAINEIVSMFKNDKNKKYLLALGSAASLFNNKDWLSAVIKMDENSLYLAAFSLLPQQQQEAYAIRFLGSEDTAPQVINELTSNSTAEWSVELTKAIFHFTAKRPYQYNRSFYNQNMQFIPTKIIPELEKCTPPDEYNKMTWSKTSNYITKLLTIKHQTAQAFGNLNS